MFSIPTVDLSNIHNPSTRQRTVDQIHEACGFFQLIGHGVTKELRDAVFAGAESLFKLPLEEKKELDMRFCGGRGFELFAAQSLSSCQTSPNQHDVVFEGVYREDKERGGGWEDIIASLRLLHYPLTNEADTIGAGAHTDFGFITLLLQDSIGGLEILSPTDGKTWIPVSPNPEAYVVNIGGMLQIFTKRRFKSSLHRVVLEEGRGDRYSIPFFFDGRAGFVVSEGEDLTVEGYMRLRFSGTYKN